MKQTKKLLSVILALVMLMTSVSVCFTCFAAANYSAETYTRLKELILDDELRSIAPSITNTAESGYGGDSARAVYELSYDQFIKMNELFRVVKEAAQQTAEFIDKADKSNCGSNNQACTAPYYIHLEMEKILNGTTALEGFEPIDTTTYAVKDLYTFVRRIILANPAVSGHEHDNNSKKKVTKTSYASYLKSDDIAGYLITLDSYSDVAESLELGSKFITYMAEKSYGSFLDYHSHLRLDGKNNFMVNTENGVNSKTIDTQKFTDFANSIAALEPYFGKDVDEFFPLVGTDEFDTIQNDLNVYETLKAYLESSEVNPYADYTAEVLINHLFGDEIGTKVKALSSNVASAASFQTLLDTADQWKAFADAHPEYGTYCYPELDEKYENGTLNSDFTTFSAIYALLEDCTPKTRAIIEESKGISFSYYDEFYKNVKVYELVELKKSADAFVNNREAYEEMDNEALQGVSSQVMAIANNIKAFDCPDERIFNDVFPDGYQYILDFAYNIYCEKSEILEYFSNLVYTSYTDKASWELSDVIIELNAEERKKYGELDSYYSEYAGKFGMDVAEMVLGELYTKAHQLEDDLYAQLAERITAQVNASYDVYISIGQPDSITLENYRTVKPICEAFEQYVYDFLEENGKLDLLTKETKDRYDFIKAGLFDKYNKYKKVFGLDVFKSSKPLTYASRAPYAEDKIKTEDYIVTKENIINTINKVDKILTGTQFAGLIKELTGTDIGDLGTFLNSTVKDLIFSNSFVNIVVKLLYSLVLGEFEKVFSTLPPEVSGFTVKYRKSLYNISEIGNLMLYPSSLAKVLPADEKYDTIREQLTAADAYAASWTDSTEPTYKGYDLTSEQSWKNPAIYDAEKDALTLDWGVDSAEDKEAAFYEAFAASMEGLRPLILALLCGEKWTCQEYGSNGKGTEKIETIAEVNVGVGKVYVDLKLGAAGNDGYSNALVPAFEALGIDYNYPTSATVNGYKNDANFENLAKAIFKPVLKLVDEVAKNPVDKIIEILPNLAYALESGMIVNLLNQLKADIAYEASTRGSNFLVNAAMALIGPELPKGAVTIQVGDILKDALRNSPGIDIEGGLEGILGGLGIVVPGLDVLYIAQCGELKPLASTKRVNAIYDTSIIKDGTAQAYTIKANKEDLTYYILTYVFKLLKNESDLRTLLSSIMKLTIDKADYTGEDGIVDEEALNAAAVEKANPIINTIKSIPLKTPGDIVAAIVELAEAKEYPDSTFSYTPAEENDTVTEVSLYTKYWTKEKAQYVADNLVTFVEKTAMLVGYDITEIINDLISSLYTSANLEKLASLLGDLLSGIIGNGGTVDTVLDIVGKVSTLDTDAIFAAVDSLVNYTAPEFEDGDRDAFVAALKDAIIPFVPIIKLLLIDKRDGNIITLLEQVQIKGYNGYNSGLIPILEAIGCDSADITPYAEFVTLSDDAMVDSVLQPILNLIDDIATDPVNKVVDLIPNIVFFISCNGLQQAVDNLLKPIYIVLDVIRPIYDVPFNTDDLNLQEMLIDLLAKANLKSVSYNDLKYAIEQMGTLQEYQSANGSTGTKLVVDNSLSADLITLVLYEVLATVITADNVDKIIDKINEDGRLTEQQAKDVSTVLKSLVEIGENDKILFVLFYVFFGVNEGYETADDIAALVDSKMQKALKSIGGMKSSDFQNFVITSMYFLNFLAGALEDVTTGKTEKTNFFKTIIDKIVEIWNRILAFFKIK